mmetsp:Transcript_3973/g.5524  ORF Transcript_3973/g.5524 Transcript_3973/m.5524 type:complete len:264 (+) Transcript_3973:73-864(+)
MNFGKKRGGAEEIKQDNDYGTNLAQAQEFGKKALDSKPVQWGKWELERLKGLAMENSGDSLKFKTLSFAAGVAMCSSGLFGFFTQLFSLSVMHAMVELYVLCFGIVALIIDAQEVLCPANRRAAIYKYAKFMFTLWGKGLFYLFVGSLMIAQWSMFDVVIGLYVALVGVYMLYTGYHVHKKLAALKTHLSDDNVLKRKFNEMDVDHSGALEGDEIVKLCKALGSDLTAAELESFVLMIPRNSQDKVEFPAFLQWWKGDEAAQP